MQHGSEKFIGNGKLETLTKNISIRGSRKVDESYSWERKVKDDYHVSLLPEGGNLLTGVLCKVAFKAQNVSGYSEHITGEIIDEKGQSVCPVITK